MPGRHRPVGPDLKLATAVDHAAAALLSVWNMTSERTATRLPAAQLSALLVLEQGDGINLGGLASQLNMILSSASRLCDRLVAAGLIERAAGRADRRQIALFLTPIARAVLTEVRTDRQARLASVLGRMTPAAQASL